jgi:eight-cysteine-cluster-containing protein
MTWEGSMNERRFDDLAKTLAAPASRGSLLKTAGIAVAALAMGALRPATASAAPQCEAFCRAQGLTGAAFGRCMSRCNSGDLFGTCTTDTDCFHTGCSGQICASREVPTTCEFRCEYACFAEAPCRCIGGSCGFANTPQLRECLNACQQL